MIDVVKIIEKPTTTRLGIVHVKYYELVLCCEYCIYKEEKLWIRMPEVWLTTEVKKSYVYWMEKDKSAEFQMCVLKKLFDMINLTLDSAKKIRADFFKKRKQVTIKKEKISLSEKKTPSNEARRLM